MPSVERTHYCEICHWSPANTIGDKASLFRHYLMVHVDKNDKFRFAYLYQNSLRCDCCYKMLRRDLAFKHYLTLHSDLTDGEKQIYRRADYPAVTKQCDVCLQEIYPNKVFRHFLAKHTNLSDKDKHICDHCECAFPPINSLAAHWFRMHTAPISEEDKKSIQCDICLKEFYLNKDGKAPIKNFYQHFLVRHSNAAEKFVCDVCDHTSTTLTSLWIHTTCAGHLAQAESGKPACDICGIEFFHKKSLLNHHRFEHRNKGEVETFDCEKCGFSTNIKVALSAHIMQQCMLKRVMYQCGDCERLLKNRNSLYNHRARYHNERMLYVCDSCDKIHTRKWSILHSVHCRNFVK